MSKREQANPWVYAGLNIITPVDNETVESLGS